MRWDERCTCHPMEDSLCNWCCDAPERDLMEAHAHGEPLTPEDLDDMAAILMASEKGGM